jgi:hypothetical protein
MSRLVPPPTRVPLTELASGLRACCPRKALQDALNGLEPDEITGPGGLVSELAGRAIQAARDDPQTD